MEKVKRGLKKMTFAWQHWYQESGRKFAGTASLSKKLFTYAHISMRDCKQRRESDTRESLSLFNNVGVLRKLRDV